jgi:hypothetical protein
VAETYPAQALDDSTFISVFNSPNVNNGTTHVQAATATEWLDHAGRVALVAKADAGTAFTGSGGAFGTLTRHIDHPTLGVVYSEVEDFTFGVFFQPGDPVAFLEMLGGRVIIRRNRQHPSAPDGTFDQVYVDGALVFEYAMLPSPAAVPQPLGIVSTWPRLGQGDGQELERVNGGPMWTVRSGTQNIVVFTTNERTDHIVFRMFRAPLPHIAPREADHGNWGENAFVPDRRPSFPSFQDKPQWYSVAVIPAERAEGEDPPLLPVSWADAKFLLLHAIDPHCLQLSVQLHSVDGANGPTAAALYDAMVAGAELPEDLYGEDSELGSILFSESWRGAFDSLASGGSTWAGRTALRVQLLAVLDGIAATYTSVRAALIQAAEDEDQAALAALWDPIRDALRATYGDYHTVVANTIGDADSVVKTMYGDYSLGPDVTPVSAAFFPDWKEMYDLPAPPPPDFAIEVQGGTIDIPGIGAFTPQDLGGPNSGITLDAPERLVLWTGPGEEDFLFFTAAELDTLFGVSGTTITGNGSTYFIPT